MERLTPLRFNWGKIFTERRGVTCRHYDDEDKPLRC
jgi:hypothetical protein